MTLRRSPALILGLIHITSRAIRRDGGIHENSFEWMIEIPVIHDVLVVPDDLAGVGVQASVQL